MIPLMVSPTVWVATIILIIALFAFDYFFHVRKAHVPTLKEAAIWSCIYIGIAILFGVVLWIFTPGHTAGVEYFAGYVTEKALSVDNLFVFLVIISSFKVPREDQQKVLLFGIMFALISRSVLIAAGAALINSFSWIFYIFGLFLILTAGHLVWPGDDDEEDASQNRIIRFMKKHMNTTDFYDGDKLTTVVDGKRKLTPMLLVMLSIGFTDVLFAFDSIPAIYGLTSEPYIVFTATAFSLMGLRQLYFLIDGLLDRLVYLSYGLSAILALIGVKLILHALATNNLPFINNGEPVHVIEITTGQSLLLIILILLVTVLVSLYTPSGKAKTAMANVERHVDTYLNLDREDYPNQHHEAYVKLVTNEQKLRKMPGRFKKEMAANRGLLLKMDKAHEIHRKKIEANPEARTEIDDLEVVGSDYFKDPSYQVKAHRPEDEPE